MRALAYLYLSAYTSSYGIDEREDAVQSVLEMTSPTNLIFLIDMSSSMYGRTTDIVDSVEKMLHLLEEQDWFNIILFDREVSSFSPDSIRAGHFAKAAAMKWMSVIGQPMGSTNLESAMIHALSDTPKKDANLTEIIYLVTDGRVTAGNKNWKTISANIKRLNGGRFRIFTLLRNSQDFGEELRIISEQNNGTIFTMPEKDLTKTDYLYQYEYSYADAPAMTTEQVFTYFTTVATTTSIEIIKPTKSPGSSACLPHGTNIVENVIESITRKSVTFCLFDKQGNYEISSLKAKFKIRRKECSPQSGWRLKFYKSRTESFGRLRSTNCKALELVVRRGRLFIRGASGELDRLRFIAQF